MKGSMNDLGLEQAGIREYQELFYNLSYDELFRHETDPALQGFERGIVTTLGAVSVDTGVFTGRSPKDKYCFWSYPFFHSLISVETGRGPPHAHIHALFTALIESLYV